MRSSRIEELGDRVLAALNGGASVARAAERVGLSEQTVRSWIRRGRSDPGGRFGPFAEAFEQRRRPRLAVVGPDAPPSPDAPLAGRAELLRRLDEKSRAGSVRATEVLLREVGAVSGVDPFASLDAVEVRTPRRPWPAA